MASQNNKNREVIKTLLTLGTLLRSSKVTMELTGPESQVVQNELDNLQTFLNQLNKDELIIVEPVSGYDDEDRTDIQ